MTENTNTYIELLQSLSHRQLPPKDATMTAEQARTDIIKIAAEMCRWPEEGCNGVYIKRSRVNSELCKWAVRMKRVVDQLDSPIKGK